MAFPQIKKKFSLFGSPPKSPTIYFSSQEIREEPISGDYIHKSIENLEKLVLVSNEYRDCINKLSKISKNFSKCLKDYCNFKGIDNSHVQCLQFTAQFYESHAEVQAKLNKALQKEFETLQKFWDKYSKKVIKDEKAHEDYVGDLDKQIKKINKEKKSKKENKTALESHDKYMASLSSIGSDIARARTEYAEEVTKREKHTHSVISQIICRLAEGQFASFNDSLKKCGPSITKVKEWAPLAGKDMPLPPDLDSFLEMQTMTLPSENNNSNESIPSGKPSRKPSYRISQSIASISEMQKAAMDNKSKEAAPPLTEESVNTTEESLLSEKSSDHLFSISVETIGESTQNKKHTSTPPISSLNNSNSKSKPPLIKDKPLTPNLLSSLSIGIHDDDNPFFRDASNGEITSPDMITETNESEKTKPIETMRKIDNQENSTKLEENSNDKRTMNEKEIRPTSSFETEWLVRSFPIDLPVRSTPQTPSNSPRQKSGFYDNPIINNNREILHSDTLRYEVYDEEKRDAIHREFENNKPIHEDGNYTDYKQDCPAISLQNDDSHEAYDLPLSRSTKSYRDRSSPRQYDIQPRSAYTEYPLPDNKHGPSVADIRERLLLLNANERKLLPSTQDFPKPRQGYVDEVKSKFGGTNNSKSNNDTPKSADDMYPDQIEHLEEINSAFPNKSIINEQCNCHNCQEIRRAITIIPEVTTFGKR